MLQQALRCPELSKEVSTLSGGERRRLALSKLLLEEPTMMVLDEPTNHLDAESVSWLESFLQDFSGTVIAVTHDRYFLDNIASWMIELDRGRQGSRKQRADECTQEQPGHVSTLEAKPLAVLLVVPVPSHVKAVLSRSAARCCDMLGILKSRDTSIPPPRRFPVVTLPCRRDQQPFIPLGCASHSELLRAQTDPGLLPATDCTNIHLCLRCAV